MKTDFEELYLQSEQAIKEGDLIRAKGLIENMLLEDPRSAIAHNSMGWFYRVQFEDYQKAELHYKSAIRFNPDYPHAYWNYANLLMDLERFDELEKLMDRASSLPSLNKAMIFNQLAELREVQGRLDEAVALYKQAIRRSVKNEQIEQFWDSIERCEEKMRLDEDSDSPDAGSARSPRNGQASREELALD